VIRERLLALWDPFNRGTVAGDELRRAVCQASGATTVMDADSFFQVWNCHFRIHQQVMPLVEALLPRCKVALLSNCNDLHWRFIRPQIPVVERFCDRVLSYELGLAKPDPEIFRAALRRVGNPPPETCAFFDDMPAFVQVARTLGIQAEVFTDAANFRGQLARLGLTA
jgi:FMN phosphatase YigB (HAD superfamily)